jgi:hypothetical protein
VDDALLEILDRNIEDKFTVCHAGLLIVASQG